jgi:hypothetical protein
MRRWWLNSIARRKQKPLGGRRYGRKTATACRCWLSELSCLRFTYVGQDPVCRRLRGVPAVSWNTHILDYDVTWGIDIDNAPSIEYRGFLEYDLLRGEASDGIALGFQFRFELPLELGFFWTCQHRVSLVS